MSEKIPWIETCNFIQTTVKKLSSFTELRLNN